MDSADISREQIDFMDEVFNNMEDARKNKTFQPRGGSSKTGPNRGQSGKKRPGNTRPGARKRLAKTAPNANRDASKLGDDTLNARIKRPSYKDGNNFGKVHRANFIDSQEPSIN